MRIIAASSVDYSGPVPILQPNNADVIRIIEFVNGVLGFCLKSGYPCLP